MTTVVEEEVKPKKAPKPKREPSPTGAGRKPGEHIMSVHIPLGLLKRVDAMCKVNKKAGGKNIPQSRSALAVYAIKEWMAKKAA